jgi:ATP-dependent Zn protease
MSSSSKRAQRRRTAYHEAGHAVANQHHDVPFRSITIRSDANSYGHVRVYAHRLTADHVYNPSPRVRDHLERLVVCLLAGREAERLVASRYNHLGAGHLRMGKYARLSPGSDLDQAIDYAGRVVSLEGEEGRAYFHWLTQRTRAFVTRRHDEIAAVADALIERETLTADEVRDVVWQSLQDRISIQNRRSLPSAPAPVHG